MESLSCRNLLEEVEKMGFLVTWKFINIGLYGTDKIPIQISYDEVFEYFDNLLSKNEGYIDEIIDLICEKDDKWKVDALLKSFAKLEPTEETFEERKWRAYLLKKIIDNGYRDYLQGLLEFMEFWITMGVEEDCPHIFPEKNSTDNSVQQYFTQTMYNFLRERNLEWLNKEIVQIIAKEQALK